MMVQHSPSGENNQRKRLSLDHHAGTMSTKSTKTDALTELLAALAAGEDTPAPPGRLSRMTRMVLTSMGAGLSAVSKARLSHGDKNSF